MGHFEKTVFISGQTTFIELHPSSSSEQTVSQ